ncbi:MAG: SdpI family protein [Methanobrevibacter sp.]|nr:SdpI family protein [Methanobrevibacter sp.]
MKIIKFVFPLVVLNLIALILVSFGLPDIVPIHINLDGAVDGFASKWYIPIIGMIPIFIAIIYIIYCYTVDEINLNKNIEDKLIPAVTILVMVFSWIPVFLALALTNINGVISQNFLIVEISVFISIILAIFFVIVAHYMEDIKPNNYLGIRTPWTLKNDLVWEKTHRLGSYTFMIAGFILIVYGLATFISENFIYLGIGLFIAIFLAAFIPIIYSYYEFKKLNGY